MRRLVVAFMAALATATAAHAGAPVRLITATAEPGFNRQAVTQIVSVSQKLRGDVGFNVMASRLGDALAAAGLNVRQDAVKPDVLVIFEYKALALPIWKTFGPVSDPAYRAAVITAVDGKLWRESKTIKVLWQTAFDQTGLSSNAEVVLPPLLKAGVPWYGRNLTEKGLGDAALCSKRTIQTGSRVAGACQGTSSQAGLITSFVSTPYFVNN